MPRLVTFLLSLLLAGCACSAERAETGAPVAPADAASSGFAEDTIMRAVAPEAAALMADPGFRSLSGVVVYRGRVQTFHFGQLPSGQKPDDRTLYEIGSITKTFTGLLLARAVRDRKVELDTPVSSYLPDVDLSHLVRNGKAVTLRHLATHMSGLPTLLACDDREESIPARTACLAAHDDRDFLARLAEVDLRSDPGDTYLYSNAGGRLIGLVLERVYGTSYPELLQRFVFADAGEEDTYCRVPPKDRARLAMRNDTNLACDGAGGLVSSTADMGRYLAVYLSENADLAAQATTPLLQLGQWGRAYLWNTYRPDTEGMLYHGGGSFNTSSWVSIYPRERIGIFLVTPNVADGGVQAKLNDSANAIVTRLRGNAQ